MQHPPLRKALPHMFKLTPPLVNWPGPDCDDDREDGFTLIEILVVIIIIGILAAVAIPIFLNQQKAARDSATTQDTRNAATALETGLVYDDTATSFKAYEDAAGTTPYASPSGLAPGEEAVVIPGEDEEFYIQVGDGPITKTKKTEGTSLLISNDDIDGDGSPEAGAFRVDGWNEKGREHVSESTLVYRNALGGLQSEKGTVGAGGVTNPGDDTENPGGVTNPGDDTENPGENTLPPLEVDGVSHADGDWWEGKRSGWVISADSLDNPKSFSAGETFTYRTYAYLPASMTGTGESHFVPDGTVATWALATEEGRYVDSGEATANGGVFEFQVTAPTASDRYLKLDMATNFPPSMTLPDGTKGESRSAFGLVYFTSSSTTGPWNEV